MNIEGSNRSHKLGKSDGVHGFRTVEQSPLFPIIADKINWQRNTYSDLMMGARTIRELPRQRSGCPQGNSTFAVHLVTADKIAYENYKEQGGRHGSIKFVRQQAAVPPCHVVTASLQSLHEEEPCAGLSAREQHTKPAGEPLEAFVQRSAKPGCWKQLLR